MTDADAAPRPLDATLEWMRRGELLFGQRLAEIDDAAFGTGTALPGWTVAHLVAHLADNAEALSRLAGWARTGVENPMYASPDARDAGIQQGAAQPAERLRARVRQTSAALGADLAALPADAWSAPVVTAQGRTVQATEIPWMRTREVWIHAVDLAGDADFGRFPDGLIDALLDDVTAQRERLGRGPALSVAPDDRDRTWRVPLDGADPVRVTGGAADLARWLTGRGGSGVQAPGGPPELGRWL